MAFYCRKPKGQRKFRIPVIASKAKQSLGILEFSPILALGILEFLKSLQRENMQEIKKNYGLILKGGNITLSDFTFERPFALLGNNLLVKVIGGGIAI